MSTLISRPRGLTWAVLRTHRASVWVWGATVVVGVATLLWLRSGENEAAEHIKPCGPGPRLEPCSDDVPVIAWAYDGLLDLVAFSVILLPFAVAALVAGPMIGRELENGTATLAWTQSTTPTRWLVAKLAVPGLLLVGGTGLLVAGFHWVWRSTDANLRDSWYREDVFAAAGPVGIAHTLLALAIGLLAGLLLRRALPALGVAVAAVLAVQSAAFQGFRFELWPGVTLKGAEAAKSMWGLEGTHTYAAVIPATGERISFYSCNFSPKVGAPGCQDATGAMEEVHLLAHPASHFWPLQLVETGIVLALAAACVGAAFWVLRRRVP